MNRTKMIYFLSAFVLILGCYTLNKSYSLFTSYDESEPIESVVPKLDVSLSMDSLLVEAGKEYLIKQTVTNNSVIPVNFGINSDKPENVFIAKNSSIPDNLSYGTADTDNTLSGNTTKDIYLIVSNKEGTEDITINFTLEYDYSTIKVDSTTITNLSNEQEIEIQAGLPYSDKPNTLAYKIIENFANSDLYTSSSSGNIDFNKLFKESSKLETPVKVDSSFEVPSPVSFTDVEKTEVGLYQTEDDYGISYYFRGASTRNFVNFAGFTWRIVRINGDGSVRLLLNENLDSISKIGEATPVYKNDKLYSLSSFGRVSFNSNMNADNAYVGYMFGTAGSDNYDDTHKNLNSSTVKIYVDAFYEEYLLEYQDYLADTLFCGDKTRADGYTTLGFGTQNTYYGAYDRLYKSSNFTPTLKCANETIDTNLSEMERSYSRYTSEIDPNTRTPLGVLVNNDLKYPIALLSADEVVFAGASYGIDNKNSYIYETFMTNHFWLLTPHSISKQSSFISSFGYGGKLIDPLLGMGVMEPMGVHPVINLSADVIWAEGDGTSETPYKVSLPENNTNSSGTVTFNFYTDLGLTMTSSTYTVASGTTFSQFVNDNSDTFSYDQNRGIMWKIASTLFRYDCYSESGTLATIDGKIENGQYTCNSSYNLSGSS